MSAYAYIGLQGSGKTLHAVSKLYDNFINPKTKDRSEYDYALTNINEFKFELTDGKVNKLDFDELYEQLVQLFDISVNQKETDTVLNEKAKEFNLYNCLIVIDEAPHYFVKDKDTVLLWWIEYHRHMHQDIILITQNKVRFRTEYRNSIHYFVKSVSAKYRLLKSVYRYAVFSNYAMNKDDFEYFESFKVKKELYELYVSGKAINGTPVFYFYIGWAVILISGFIYLGNNFINQFSNNEEQKEQITEKKEPIQKQQLQVQQNKQSHIIEDEIIENEKMFKIKCKNDFCSIIIDSINYEFPVNFIEDLITKSKSNKIFIQESKIFTTYYLLTNQNSFDFIQINNTKSKKGVKDENDKKDSGLFGINN